jgi:chromosome segregation ATPase
MAKAQSPSDYETPHRDSSSGEPSDPNERLQQLQSELGQHNARIDHLSKQRDALQTDITDLTANWTEVKTTLANYAGALPGLESRLQALQYFFEQKDKMVLAAIGEEKGPIDELIRKFDHEIEMMSRRLTELGEKRDAAQKESAHAADAQAKLQNDFDSLNQYQQSATAKLTDMENLRSQITAFDDKNDVASMYFLIHEFQHTLSSTEINPQHKLALQLRQTLGKLEAAKENSRAKSAAYNELAAEYTAHEATLQAKEQARRDQLLSAVQAMCPPQPASTASAATGANAGTGASPATTAPTAPGTATPSPAAGQKK